MRTNRLQRAPRETVQLQPTRVAVTAEVDAVPRPAVPGPAVQTAMKAVVPTAVEWEDDGEWVDLGV